MKKSYLSPEIIIVQLQHQGLLMQSVEDVQSNAVGYGGASSNNDGGIIRTKESGDIWDEEW
ncbi:MAG: hypothetical protein IJK51_05510 [Bacteroidaceae bacterium]|jgi:hypothetical protein|nr:hypothetical protein [Bacteroidaceae bacterium]